jgi:hypothetical protein
LKLKIFFKLAVANLTLKKLTFMPWHETTVQ